MYGQRFPELRAEALTFPVASHDDLLDALAGAYDNAKIVPTIAPSGGEIQSKYAIGLEGIRVNRPRDR